jgi:hypothetical protein
VQPLGDSLLGDWVKKKMKVSLVTRAFVTWLLLLAGTAALVLGCLLLTNSAQHRGAGCVFLAAAAALLVGGMVADWLTVRSPPA